MRRRIGWGQLGEYGWVHTHLHRNVSIDNPAKVMLPRRFPLINYALASPQETLPVHLGHYYGKLECFS
jgi:hypothetical protein